MRQPEEFDAFYKDARDRLLAQTYALTGDLGAARRAVRDAFVAAWHRWRKLSGLGDPEAVVRPHAFRLAQRRSTARVWHREKGIDAEVRATLEALGRLSSAQRRALVLTQLAAVSMPEMARELGVPLERAERELQSGTSALSLALDVPGSDLRARFEALARAVEGRGRFPRPSIVRRDGAARRRAQTLVGAVGVVAAVVATGSLVTDAAGVRPTLEAHDADSSSTPGTPTVAPGEVDDGVAVALPESALLTATDLGDAYGGRAWTAGRTIDNSTGNGLALPCQLARYADPSGTAGLLRTFSAGRSGARPALEATQLTESSARRRSARQTYRTTAGWFAGCAEPRMQLLGTRTPTGVGDESVQIVLRSHTAPVTTYVVGVARTGLFTTTTVVASDGSGTPDRGAPATVLAAGVGGLCALPGGGACAPARVELAERDPLPAGRQPALLSEVDLPAVPGIRDPWVGTQPKRALTNAAATGCDRTSFDGSFRGARFTRDATRTFVVPGADLPREFGLTETVGALPAARAAALVAQVRERLAGCAERDLNTEVDEITDRDDGPTALTAWRLQVEVSDARTITFLMAIIRDRTSIAQLTFIPAPRATVGTDDFVYLAERAAQRLRLLPRPVTR